MVRHLTVFLTDIFNCARPGIQGGIEVAHRFPHQPHREKPVEGGGSPTLLQIPHRVSTNVKASLRLLLEHFGHEPHVIVSPSQFVANHQGEATAFCESLAHFGGMFAQRLQTNRFFLKVNSLCPGGDSAHQRQVAAVAPHSFGDETTF